MLSRTRRARPRSRFALETLESRTLLSTATGTISHALFTTSYASLHLNAATSAKPATPPTTAPRPAAPRLTASAQARLNQAMPPTFLESLQVTSNADGTSAAIIDYEGVELGTYAATARWDGGPAETILIDQPGEFDHEPTIGSAYALRTLGVGQHTLEVTVTNADRFVSATTSTSFSIEAIEPEPVPSEPGFGASPDFAAPDSGESPSSNPESVPPTITAVYVSGSAWSANFKNYLQSQGLGDAAGGFAIPANDQLNELPWTGLDRVSVRFSEHVIVARSDLLVKGVNVLNYSITGSSYDPATFTATWTLGQTIANDNLLLHVTNFVTDADGDRLDGEWTNGFDAFPSGDGSPDGVFQFRVNTRPGDADRDNDVDDIDQSQIRSRYFKSTTNPGHDTAAPYSVFHDLDGNGSILATDFSLAGQRWGTPPTDGEPVAPVLPAVPAGLSAASASSRVTLTWGSSAAATSYNLYRGTGSGPVGPSPFETGLSATTYADAMVIPATYIYSVTAVNGAGQSAQSATATATVPPAPPTDVTAGAAPSVATSIDVYWTASTTAGVAYNVYMSTTPGFTPGPGTLVTGGVSGVRATVPNLNPSTDYYFAVTATANGAESESSRANGGASTRISNPGQPADSGTLPLNDDSYSQQVSLGFEINFYGRRFAHTFVNNNGNVTFSAGDGRYTPDTTFLDAVAPMIAPFWADVDTRRPASGGPSDTGAVRYGPATVAGRSAFLAEWTNVGYYREHYDKRNTFSLKIVDRSDVNTGDFDIIFNYSQIQWETGDASYQQEGPRPSGGMGGIPARAGYTNGARYAAFIKELAGSGSTGGLIGKTGQEKFEIRNPDLDVKKVSHNVGGGFLPDAEEETAGAFVPINNDDDDYDASNIEDRLQTGAIAGETDLLPVVLRRFEAAQGAGNYRLVIPSNLSVWRNADRNDQVTPTTDVSAAADTTLYVEGTGAGTGTIKVNWSDGPAAQQDVDRIKVTVFDWSGPLNVPGFSIHRYVASGALPGSQWELTENIVEGHGTSDAKYLSGSGATVEKRSYKVNDNFVWDLEVNVVEVTITPPTTAGYVDFRSGAPADGGNVVGNGVLRKYVAASGPGLAWAANVKLTGPNGRGVKKMVVGFIQNATNFYNAGIYETGSGLASSVNGMVTGSSPVLDRWVEFTLPWYFLPTGGNGNLDQLAENLAPSAGSTNVSVEIGSVDSPFNGPPLTFDMGGTVEPNDSRLRHMSLHYSFVLDLCVQTKDVPQSANSVYTRRATAQWSFDGNGAVAEQAPYAWTADGARITKPVGGWIAIQDGSQPKTIGGPVLNELLSTETFSVNP